MTRHQGTERPTGERVEIYSSPDAVPSERWRWRFYDTNGREISSSTEGYEHRRHAIDQAIERNPGVRVFEAAFDTDQSSDAPEWIELETE